jgi:hypothetical protein
MWDLARAGIPGSGFHVSLDDDAGGERGWQFGTKLICAFHRNNDIL